MMKQIEFTYIIDKSILTRVKDGDKDISILTLMTDRKEQKFVSDCRVKDDILDRCILELITTNPTDALMNHVAMTKAALENDHQNLINNDLKQHSLDVINTLNQSGIYPSKDTFDTLFTKRFLKETIGYSAWDISDLKSSKYAKYAKYAITILIAILIFNCSFP